MFSRLSEVLTRSPQLLGATHNSSVFSQLQHVTPNVCVLGLVLSYTCLDLYQRRRLSPEGSA